jgi:hypothetical protein
MLRVYLAGRWHRGRHWDIVILPKDGVQLSGIVRVRLVSILLLLQHFFVQWRSLGLSDRAFYAGISALI